MAPSTKLVLAVCLLGVASGLVLLNLSFFVTADMFWPSYRTVGSSCRFGWSCSRTYPSAPLTISFDTPSFGRLRTSEPCLAG